MQTTPSKKRTLIIGGILVLIAIALLFFSGSSDDQARVDLLPQTEPEMVGFDGAISGVTEEAFVEPQIAENFAAAEAESLIAKRSAGSTTLVAEDSIGIPPVADGIPRPDAEQRIIRTGNIDMQVNSVDRATAEIRSIAQSIGGDTVSSNFFKSTDNLKSGYLTVKVPSDRFHEAFDRIKAVASVVVRESSDARDVTDQFVDLTARLENQKRHEERLRSHFEQAENVTEILAVERELARVRGEIERMEAQRKSLEDQSSFSTITVTLSEDNDIIVSDSWRPWQVAKDAVNTLITKAQRLVNNIIVVFIEKLPFGILFLIVAWIVYRIGKKLFTRFGK